MDSDNDYIIDVPSIDTSSSYRSSSRSTSSSSRHTTRRLKKSTKNKEQVSVGTVAQNLLFNFINNVGDLLASKIPSPSTNKNEVVISARRWYFRS